MVCRHVLCHAWDTKVLVVNFYTDLCVLKVVVVRRSHWDEMACGWKDVLLSQLSMCVNIANYPNGFVTRMGLLAESINRQTQRR